jgi:hypothetical protein
VSPPSFPQTFPCSGAPFPPRGPSGRFPRFFGTTKHSDFLRPSRVASFPSLRGTAAPWASLPQTQDAPPAGRGFSPESPNRFIDGGNRTAQVPAGPTVDVPCSSTPAGPLRSATTALRCCLPPNGRRRLPRVTNISRLNHTARPFAVYASQGGLPHRHARLASGGWPTLPGGTGYPPGPNERFQVIPSSFPGFAWRTQIILKVTPPCPSGVAFVAHNVLCARLSPPF